MWEDCKPDIVWGNEYKMADAQTIVGNLTGDPEKVDGLEFTKVRMSIAVDNGTKRDSDVKKDPTFVPVELTGYDAENALASFSKGQRVAVRGVWRSFVTEASVGGNDRKIPRLAFDAWEAFASVKYGTSKFTRTAGGGAGNDGASSAPKAAAKTAAAKSKPAAAAAPAGGGW